MLRGRENLPSVCSTYILCFWFAICQGIAFEIIATLLSCASFSLVVAIGVDRFLAIHLHLRYQELVTHKRVVAVVISIWTLSLLFSLLIFYLALHKPVPVVISAFFGFCFIITGIINSRMYSTARHHANQIQVLQIQVAQNNQIESVARNRKSAISMFYVYLVFLGVPRLWRVGLSLLAFCCVPRALRLCSGNAAKELRHAAQSLTRHSRSLSLSKGNP